MTAPERKRLPPVFGTAELAAFLHWPAHRVRRWCKRNGIGKTLGPRCRLEITFSQLLAQAPDVYFALLAAGAMDVTTRATPELEDDDSDE
jgi:uncharacterized membrane protein